MSYFWMTVIGIGFIFLSSTLGAALVYCFKKEFSPKANAAFLGLASGIMLAASVWSLILPAFDQAETRWGRYAVIPISLGLLFGGAFLWAFDRMCSFKNTEIGKKSVRLFLAVTLHNIPESLAVGFAFGSAWAIGTEASFLSALGVAIGIGIQNFPEGAAVALPMRAELKSKHKAFLYGFASGAIEPIFAVIGCAFAAYLHGLQPWLLSFAAGAMLFVVVQDLLPDTNTQEGGATIGAWSASLGFVLMMILDVVLA